ncbi:serine hydrolase [Limnohabitans sp. HM2-2]|uniref:Serine hydrolase n=2 Tax=Limnohabitans lacus TaxID=3045173 RepID=A0ABT6X602_9BURK|nr:serine hydrolase [Limnohabitans sp. HM2-2]MDI9233550.1 serine hydrolase [Limnohabitans sp. HM2-2]
MEGSPPPADKVIRFADGSGYKFPQTRWSFSNFRQLIPTTQVSRGMGAPAPLPRALRNDLDAVSFVPLGKDTPMTWAQAFDANYTDGVVVLHKGRIVYERYAGALRPEGQHISMSVTKSFFGTLGAMLVAEGKLDENAQVSRYVPELKDSAFGDATIRQVLDMRTGLKYSENYLDPNAEIWQHTRAGGVLPRPPGYQGPQTFYEFLQTVKKEGEHGGSFAYKTVNSDALGWVIRRATGQSIGQLLSDRIWSRLGMEQDAYFTVDSVGNEFAGGGLNAGLRDMARFGEMMRNQGKFNGQQIIPASVVQDIAKGGDKSAFPQASFPTLPGWSYRNMWWVSNNEHGAYSARGIHGQAIYIDPKAEMVIARFASHPMPNNPFNDPNSLPAYMALAKHLMK